MNNKSKFNDYKAVYFINSSVVGWADVFTLDIYRNILLDGFRYCQEKQGLKIHGWILMPNYFNLICSLQNGHQPELALKNIRIFTTIKIIEAIVHNEDDDRKEWLLNLFEQHAQHQNNSMKYQFWKREDQFTLMDSKEMFLQRLRYMHQHPVLHGFVREAEDWLYSSAIDYSSAIVKGLLNLELLG